MTKPVEILADKGDSKVHSVIYKVIMETGQTFSIYIPRTILKEMTGNEKLPPAVKITFEVEDEVK